MRDGRGGLSPSLGWAPKRFTEMDLFWVFLKKENRGADSCVSPFDSGKEMTPTRQTRSIGAREPVLRDMVAGIWEPEASRGELKRPGAGGYMMPYDMRMDG